MVAEPQKSMNARAELMNEGLQGLDLKPGGATFVVIGSGLTAPNLGFLIYNMSIITHVTDGKV